MDTPMDSHQQHTNAMLGAAPPPSLSAHRGLSLVVQGVLSLLTSVICVGLPWGFAVLLMARTDQRRMRRGQMDPSGRALTRAAQLLGVIAMLASVLFLAFALLVTCAYLRVAISLPQ